MSTAGGMLLEFLQTPVGIAVASVSSLLIAAITAYVVARVGYLVLSVVAGPFRYVSSKLVPEGPAGVLTAMFLLVAVVLLVAVPLPDAVGSFGDGDGGAASQTASGFLDEAFEDGQMVRADDGTVSLDASGYDRPTPDTAGDRLKDGALRAGETQEGAPLPNGSVGRLDLYVYVVHGSNVEPLTEREKHQLRDVWASMPVENPDGTTGIDIHIEEGGQLDEAVRFRGDDDHTDYYTDDLLGARRCRYHLVVLGEPTTRYTGWGAAPGYSSFVTGVRTSNQKGNVTNRVRVMTHELLHNVVGHIDEPELPDRGLHTQNGWLGGETYLSEATAAQLNDTRFRGSSFYQRQVCTEA